WQTGHIDVFRTRTVQEKSSLTGDRVLPLIVESSYAADIDTNVHMRIAEELVGSGTLDVVRPPVACSPLLADVHLLVFDFDGVFTDNRVWVDQTGIESVSCSREDGLGIERLLDNGIEAAVLSTEVNAVVAERCRKLNLSVQQGLRDKQRAFRDLVASRGLSLTNVAYIGNDVNDLECLKIAGVAVAPADAHPAVLRIVDLVLGKRGGHGAVREICELAVAAHEQQKEGICAD